jgi:hypothetical protein
MRQGPGMPTPSTQSGSGSLPSAYICVTADGNAEIGRNLKHANGAALAHASRLVGFSSRRRAKRNKTTATRLLRAMIAARRGIR